MRLNSSLLSVIALIILSVVATPATSRAEPCIIPSSPPMLDIVAISTTEFELVVSGYRTAGSSTGDVCPAVLEIPLQPALDLEDLDIRDSTSRPFRDLHGEVTGVPQFFRNRVWHSLALTSNATVSPGQILRVLLALETDQPLHPRDLGKYLEAGTTLYTTASVTTVLPSGCEFSPVPEFGSRRFKTVACSIGIRLPGPP